MNLLEQLNKVEQHFNEIEVSLGDSEIISSPDRLRKLSKQRSELEIVVDCYKKYKNVLKHLDEAKILLEDSDDSIREMAKEEYASCLKESESLELELKKLLLPKDPNDEKNTIMEIRAGTGGEEAALFAADLFRMYARYSELKGWKLEVISSNETGLKGLKEVIFSIEGDAIFSRMKYEGGTHRVQRVPETEASGRIHTSAVTVAVLPEAEEVEVAIKPEELRIDVFRSSGPGGQSVNTTDSAVRVTHIPTGIVISCQDEKSQHKNKAKAIKVLKARLLQLEQDKQQQEISANRKMMVGSGDRSERIRTYNFPQNRVTDHRIDLTLYKLDRILEGEVDEIIDALVLFDQTEKLKNI